MSSCNSKCPKWFVGNDVRDMLLQESALTQYVGENIYPVIAPEGTKGPFILYQRDKYKKSYTKMGVFEEECHLLITVVADDYDIANALAYMIDTILQGRHDNPETGCNLTIELYDSTEGFDDNKYFENLTYAIK